jgi:hypothetical protein
MGPVSAVWLPGFELQRSATQVVLYESHRTQEVHAGACFAPFEVPAVLGTVVADTSIYRFAAVLSKKCLQVYLHSYQ